MKYWAQKPMEEIIPELQKKIDSFDDHLQTSGILSELKDSYISFYGDSKIRDTGNQGELKSVKINHYASLIRNLVSLVTNNKPAFQPIASNSDSSSQASAILATGLLDHYMKDHRLDRTFRNACLMSCFLKESWVSVTWDSQKGEIIHPGDVDNLPIHEGDLAFNIFSLNDVIRDYSRTDSKFDWLITREYKNKWDLMAQFPEHSDKIQSIQSKVFELNRIRLNEKVVENETDTIPFYTFYFKASASLPMGRMITFVEGIGLTEQTLPYSKIPLVRLSAEDTFENAFSHSPMMDVLPIQKAIDTLASILLTNNAAFGVQNITYPKGSGINVSQVAGGLNLIEYDSSVGAPAPLQLTASSPETYRFFDLLVSQSQLISGVNDAIRGQTTAGTSGAALALLSQQAIQFANGLQQGYVALIEDVGTLAIHILQSYANTKRVAVLTGKHSSPLLREWSSQDLIGISRITIESGNALSKTTSGRLTMADSLLGSGLIKRPEQYLSVLTTGQLEPIYENEQSQLLLVRKENENLQEGKQVRALVTDDHANHILEHSSVLSNPEIRDNPNSPIVQNTLSHIQEHLEMAQSISPALAMILKQQPLPQASPAQVAPVLDGTNSVTTEAGQVQGPSLPTNPATGEKVNPVN